MGRYTGLIKGMVKYVINAVSEFGLFFTVGFEYDCLSSSSHVFLDRCMIYTYVNH